MKREDLNKDPKKLSYSELRRIEYDRIKLEFGNMPLADKITAFKNLDKIKQEMGWF